MKQTKVLALKNTIKDPYRSAVSGKRIEAERQMIEIESSSPYVLSSCLKVSQYFSLFPISQQCDGFFNRLNIGKKKCYTMSRNRRQSPPPPSHKKEKKYEIFLKNNNSSRDSTVSEVYYQVHMTCVLHIARIICPIVSLVYQ